MGGGEEAVLEREREEREREREVGFSSAVCRVTVSEELLSGLDSTQA